MQADELKITSINVGREELLEYGKKHFTTGICKRPVPGAVRIERERVANDAICDPEHHGGPDQAVYVYAAEDYAWWSRVLGRECEPGLFGENLTVSGLAAEMAVGDQLRIGEVLLEATSPRIPCSTLAARMQDSNFGLAFRRARRPGVYFRVLNAGSVEAGDRISYLPATGSSVRILELFDLAFMDGQFFILDKHGDQRKLGQRKYFVMVWEPAGKHLEWRDVVELLFNKYRSNNSYYVTLAVIVLLIIAIIVIYSLA